MARLVRPVAVLSQISCECRMQHSTGTPREMADGSVFWYRSLRTDDCRYQNWSWTRMRGSDNRARIVEKICKYYGRIAIGHRRMENTGEIRHRIGGFDLEI